MQKVLLLGMGLVLLAIGRTTLADGDDEWVKMSATDDHLCFLDAEGLKCWTPQGRVPPALLPPLQEPFALWAGGGHQCVQDATGSYCWAWKDGAVKSYPDTIGATSLSVSATQLCYLKGQDARCIKFGTPDSVWEFPAVTSPPEIASWIPKSLMEPWPGSSIVAGDKFSCTTHFCPAEAGKEIDYSKSPPVTKVYRFSALYCDGDILKLGKEALAEVEYLKTATDNPKLMAVKDNLTCYVTDSQYDGMDGHRVTYTNFKCVDLDGDRDDDSSYAQYGPIPASVYSFHTALKNPQAALVTAPHNACVLDDGSVYCGDPLLVRPVREDGYQEPLKLEKVSAFVSPQHIVPFENGLCAVDESQVKCWDLVKQQLVPMVDDFKALDYADFRLETFEKTFRTLARFAYAPKKELFLALASQADNLVLPADESTGADILEQRLFLFQLADPLLESTATQRFDHYRVLYRRKLAEYDLVHSIKGLRDFPNLPQYRSLALETLAVSLQVAKGLSPEGSDQATLADLIGAAGIAVSSPSDPASASALSVKLRSASSVFNTLASGSRTQAVGLLLLELSDYLAN